MDKYPDIASGITKRDKPTVDYLWEQLSESLNSAGPPQKDTNGWRKIWTEWKSEVKRKLAQNKSEVRATGGGPFCKHKLTDTDEAVLRICTISQSVDPHGTALGLSENANGEIDKDIPSTSSKRPLSPLLTDRTSKRLKMENASQKLSNFLDQDSKIKLEQNEKLDDLIKIGKENASSLRRVYRALEKGHETIANAIEELKNGLLSSNRGILQAIQEENEIKKKQLDLDILKFEFEKRQMRDKKEANGSQYCEI